MAPPKAKKKKVDCQVFVNRAAQRRTVITQAGNSFVERTKIIRQPMSPKTPSPSQLPMVALMGDKHPAPVEVQFPLMDWNQDTAETKTQVSAAILYLPYIWSID